MIKKFLLLLLLILGFLDIVAKPVYAVGENWLDGYSYRKKITVDRSNVGTNLNNFPLYVGFSNEEHIGDSTQSDGDDVRFTASDGKTILVHEMESWQGGSGINATASAWVKIPVVTSSEDTVVYMYYGNGSAVYDLDENQVWDDNYVGVYHLAEDASNKSASNSASPTAYGGTAIRNTEDMNASGKVNGAFLMNGSSDYVNLGDINEIDGVSVLTYEAWVKPTTLTNWRAVLTKQVGSIYSTYTVMQHGGPGDGGNDDAILCVSNGTQACGYTTGSVLSAGTMKHWVMVFDGSQTGNSNRLKFYLNSSLQSLTYSGASIPSTTSSTAGNVLIGNAGTDPLYYPGLIDEVRISNVARSPEWIAFQYSNINEADNELSFSTYEARAVINSTTSSSDTGPRAPVECVNRFIDKTDIFRTDVGINNVKLFFAPVSDLVEYSISYLMLRIKKNME